MKMTFKILGNEKMKMVCNRSAESVRFCCNVAAHTIKFITTNASKFISCALDIFCSDDLICGTEEYIVKDKEVR